MGKRRAVTVSFLRLVPQTDTITVSVPVEWTDAQIIAHARKTCERMARAEAEQPDQDEPYVRKDSEYFKKLDELHDLLGLKNPAVILPTTYVDIKENGGAKHNEDE